MEGAVAAVRPNGEDAFVGMVEGDALEHIPEPRQFAQSAVPNGPVGQQSCQRREDVERMTSHAGVGGEEGGYHDIRAVTINATISRLERLAGQRCALGVDKARILRLNPLTEAVERPTEIIKRLAAETVASVTYPLKGAAKREGGHGEIAGLGHRVALIHVLHAP